MQTKTIDKLEDLKGYKWTYNGKDFILNCCNGGWILIQKNYFLQHKYHLILLTCTQGGKIINLRYHYFMHCKNSI